MALWRLWAPVADWQAFQQECSFSFSLQKENEPHAFSVSGTRKASRLECFAAGKWFVYIWPEITHRKDFLIELYGSNRISGLWFGAGGLPIN